MAGRPLVAGLAAGGLPRKAAAKLAGAGRRSWPASESGRFRDEARQLMLKTLAKRQRQVSGRSRRLENRREPAGRSSHVPASQATLAEIVSGARKGMGHRDSCSKCSTCCARRADRRDAQRSRRHTRRRPAMADLARCFAGLTPERSVCVCARDSTRCPSAPVLVPGRARARGAGGIAGRRRAAGLTRLVRDFMAQSSCPRLSEQDELPVAALPTSPTGQPRSPAGERTGHDDLTAVSHRGEQALYLRREPPAKHRKHAGAARLGVRLWGVRGSSPRVVARARGAQPQHERCADLPGSGSSFSRHLLSKEGVMPTSRPGTARPTRARWRLARRGWPRRKPRGGAHHSRRLLEIRISTRPRQASSTRSNRGGRPRGPTLPCIASARGARRW